MIQRARGSCPVMILIVKMLVMMMMMVRVVVKWSSVEQSIIWCWTMKYDITDPGSVAYNNVVTPRRHWSCIRRTSTTSHSSGLPGSMWKTPPRTLDQAPAVIRFNFVSAVFCNISKLYQVVSSWLTMLWLCEMIRHISVENYLMLECGMCVITEILDSLLAGISLLTSDGWMTWSWTTMSEDSDYTCLDQFCSSS